MRYDLGPCAPYFSEPPVIHHIGYFDPAQGAVPNPGMGFVLYAHSDHMYVRGGEGHTPLPLDRDTFDRMVALPWCHHLYVRVEWRDVQRQAGHLVLPPVWEWVIEAAEKHRKPWSFRIMPICPQSLHERSSPDFLTDRLTWTPYRKFPGDAGPDTKYFPEYDDVYLGAWQDLLRLLGERFDGHPWLEFVDISGYGKWGEWHHWPEVEYESPRHAPAVRRLVDDHLAVFRKTHSVMMLIPSPLAWKDEIMAYAIDRGCGLRRDSFYPYFTAWEYRAATYAMQPGALFVSEFGSFPSKSTHRRFGLFHIDFEGMYQRMLDIGASYLGVGFNPWHALLAAEEHAEMLGRVSVRMGYRLRPAIVWLSRAARRPGKKFLVGLINDGTAPVSGRLALRAEFTGGLVLQKMHDPGRPAPGRMEIVEMDMPDGFSAYGGDNTVALTLETRIGEKPFPVRWAVPPSQSENDGYIVRLRIPDAID